MKIYQEIVKELSQVKLNNNFHCLSEIPSRPGSAGARNKRNMARQEPTEINYKRQIKTQPLLLIVLLFRATSF